MCATAFSLFSHAATCASNNTAICGPSLTHTHTMCTIKVHGHFMGTVFKSFYNTTILISNCNEGIPKKPTNPLNSNFFSRHSIYSHTDASWSTITITITNNFIHHYNLPASILYWTLCLTISDVNRSTFKYLPHYITIFSSIQAQN
jgi:hypothetical protein